MVNSKLIFTVYWSSSSRVVNPINDTKLLLSYKRDENQYYLKQDLKKDLIFDSKANTTSDFLFFKS